jgi:hypothetical protein
MAQFLFFLSLAALLAASLCSYSNWTVSGNPLHFSLSGRHDLVCYLLFIVFAAAASGISVLFYNLYGFLRHVLAT